MANDASGLWFFDGIDIWKNFAVLIEKGTANFLAPPPAKESTVHDWGDSDGVEVDLSRGFFNQRDIPLQCAIAANTEEEFWIKRNAFLSQLRKPNLRRLTITAHGQKSYYVYYKSCSNYTGVKTLRGTGDEKLVLYQFNLLLNEPEPKMDNSNVYLVTEDGKFIIT